MRKPAHQPPTDDALCRAIVAVLPQATAAWLFGSASSGHWQLDSDIDLAVAVRPALDATMRHRAALEIGDRLGHDVDLLDFHAEHTLMQAQVLATGRLLFAQEPAQLLAYVGHTMTEYQHMQDWRQPMVTDMARRMAHQVPTP